MNLHKRGSEYKKKSTHVLKIYEVNHDTYQDSQNYDH